MFIELLDVLTGEKLNKRNELLLASGLESEEKQGKTVLVWEDEILAGCICADVEENLKKLDEQQQKQSDLIL